MDAYHAAVELDAALRSHGHRVTRARREVWDVLVGADEHLSAQGILDRIDGGDAPINESSVYRTLALFAELGLVRESRLDETATWELFHDDAAIHLVCADCALVIHHDTDLVHDLRRALEQRSDFSPVDIDVRVTGRCHNCASVGTQMA